MKQERTKMTLNDRAKQFAPFDALKGLQIKLRFVESEHERIEKGDLDEAKITKISDILQNYNKNDIVKVTYYYNGRYISLIGPIKIDITFKMVDINGKKIGFNDIYDMDVVENKQDK